jgi:transposase
MKPQSVRKTYKYRLYPTPEQEQALDSVLWRCRTLYNIALEERKTAWEQCGVSLNYYDQAMNCQTSKLHARNTLKSILKSCNTC